MEQPVRARFAGVTKHITALSLLIGGLDPRFKQGIDQSRQRGAATRNRIRRSASNHGLAHRRAGCRPVFQLLDGRVWSKARVAWPEGMHAQQPNRMRRIGVLMPYGGQTAQTRIASIHQGLESLGWIEGRNLRLEIRYPGGDPKALSAYADELVGLAPDAIVVTTNLVTTTVQQRTRTIPIIFAGVGEPVESGLVQSLARPESNTTGITNLFYSIGSKWLELIKDIAPGVARAAIVLSQNTTGNYVASIEAAGTTLGIQTIRTPFGDAAELERIIDTFAAEPNGSLILHPPGLLGTDRELMLRLAIKHRLPAVYQSRDYPVEGGLMSYGSDPADIWRQAASYVDRILRGARPADLPVQFPTKFELVINLKTAKAIGLTIPESYLNLADAVLE